MFTYSDMMKLIEAADKDELISEVSKLSEMDAKTALVSAILSWKKGNEIDRELFKKYMNK